MAVGLSGLMVVATALLAAPAIADDGCGARSAARADDVRVAQMQDKARDAVTDKASEAIEEKARDAAKDQLIKGNAPQADTPALPGGQAMPGAAIGGTPPDTGTPTLPGGQAMPGAAGTNALPGKETLPAGDMPKAPSGY